MATLVLGPLLRYVDEHEAVVWVEVDGPCEVEVLGRRARSFRVCGRHYALVLVDGLEPGTSHPYEVALDGERVWPFEGEPASVIRTCAPERSVRIVFGSCRAAAPHDDEDWAGFGVDALHTYALRLREDGPEAIPDALVLLGDQVYVDEAAPRTRAFARSRRDTSEPPGEETLDFEEYAMLYRESWSDPVVRWLLSTVPSAMIFDDHELSDDWNISKSWAEDMQRKTWWSERVVGGFTSYWLYQHLGNLPPRELEADELYRRVRDSEDGGPLLRELALRQLETTAGTRWSFARTIGGVRLVVIDSRAGRVLEPGRREMVDEDEWRFVVDEARRESDHLLLATSVPYLLGGGIHDLQAWNERVCDGCWGARAARLAEKLRRAVDLDHWASFQRSFRKLATLLRELEGPETVLVLSGDVHYAYLAETTLPRVRQVVVSPMRNLLGRKERWAQQFALSRAGVAIGRLLRRSVGAPPPPFDWRITRGPWFDNAVGTLLFEGRQARLSIERARPGPRLETVLEERLA